MFALDPNWRDWHKLWSIRLTLFWGVFSGAVFGLSAFYNYVNPWLFLGLNVVGYGTIAWARLTHQPGIEL